jgi:hypothetical protein
MKPARHVLKNVDELHKFFRGFRSHRGFGWWFRGQASDQWDLLPKAGRPGYYLPENRDLGRFNEWVRQAVAHGPLPSSEPERLALAQHHGLATRLLDWSTNPLVACFFACFELGEEDGAVFIAESPAAYLVHEMTCKQLEKHTGVYGFIPNAISPRVINQRGLFTVHCDAAQHLEVRPSRIDTALPSIVKLVIPSQLKFQVVRLANDYGIDRSMLFPDLDGLAWHINFDTNEMVERRWLRVDSA